MFEKKKSVWLFLLPGLAMLMIFYIVPFFSGIGYSLTDGSYKNAFVGLQNYRDLWGNSMFLLGLKNTMELSLICAPLLWVFSFLLASALSAIKPFGGFFRSSALMPYLTPSSAILLVWLVIFDYGGPVNRMLEAMGMERVMWLTSGALRLPVVLMFLWKNLGYNMILFMAGLAAVPQEVMDAAKMDGAGDFQMFVHLKLKYLSPTIFFVTIFSIINSFKVFREVYLLTGDYPYESLYMLQHFMNNAFQSLNYQRLSAAAIVMSLFMIVIIGILFVAENHFGKDVEG